MTRFFAVEGEAHGLAPLLMERGGRVAAFDEDQCPFDVSTARTPNCFGPQRDTFLQRVHAVLRRIIDSNFLRITVDFALLFGVPPPPARVGDVVEMSGDASLPLAGRIEALLVALVARVEPVPRIGPGRPPILPAAVLWASLTLAVLRGVTSQLGVWRIVVSRELWRGERILVSDEAVYQRLAEADPRGMAQLFTGLTDLLVIRRDPGTAGGLAPFATDVVVLDETTLDAVARSLPALRAVPLGSDALLPGKLAGVFDVRRQLWRTVHVVDTPRQNEKVLARDLAGTLAPGTLVLADLGYFGFAWFDALTDAEHWWISRLRAKTSHVIVQRFYQDETTLDALVWLGAHRADRAKHLVRLVRFRVGTTEHAYLTNVRDPHVLPLAEIARLYARRWDSELAVKLVKRELGLHLLWSAKPAVVRQQIWAVLLIAQLLQALRVEIAIRAAVDPFDVSLPLLVRHLPEYAARDADPLAAYVADGRRLGFIRPSTRTQTRAPTIPGDHLLPMPTDLPTTREPRYAGRKCGPDRANLRN